MVVYLDSRLNNADLNKSKKCLYYPSSANSTEITILFRNNTHAWIVCKVCFHPQVFTVSLSHIGSQTNEKNMWPLSELWCNLYLVSKRGVLKKVYEFIFGKSDKKKEHKVGFHAILLLTKMPSNAAYFAYNLYRINPFYITRQSLVSKTNCDLIQNSFINYMPYMDHVFWWIRCSMW